jgi:hypothetical protein
MPNATRRIIVFPVVGLALILVASPDFTALERAVSKLFLADPATGVPASASPALVLKAPDIDVGVTAEPGDPAGPPVSATTGATRSARVLVPLYLSFVALQGLDVHSTLTALNRGARETNPMMGAFVGNPAALVALKAGTAAGILYMTERVRRHSPLGAVLMMVAFNSAYASVVANNYRVAGQLDR